MRYSTLEESNRTYEADLSARGDVQLAKGLLLTGSRYAAVKWLTDELGPQHPSVQTHAKAAASALTSPTDTVVWGARAEAYARILRKREILPQIPGTLPALAGTRTPVIDEPAVTTWGIPFPATTIGVTDEISAATSYGTILGLPLEWLKRSGDAGVSVVERVISRIMREAEGTFVLDAEAAVSGVRPAGLLNGVTTSGAGSSDDIDEDLLLLWAEVRDGAPVFPAFITSPAGALYLSSLDRPMFANVKVTGGGTISGVPLIVNRAATNRLILVDGDGIIVTDGGLLLDSADSASVVLDTAPSSPAALVSGFQTDTRFLRVVRVLHWVKAHADAVGYIELPIMAGGSPL